MPKQVKSEKFPDILKWVKNCLDKGEYRFSQHATERRKERFVSLPDIIEVLRNGISRENKRYLGRGV